MDGMQGCPGSRPAVWGERGGLRGRDEAGRSPSLGAAVASPQCAWHRLARLAPAGSM